MVPKPASLAVFAIGQIKEVAGRWLLFMQRLKKGNRYRRVSSDPTNVGRYVQGWGPHTALAKVEI